MASIWQLYIQGYGFVRCATEGEALAIREEYLKRMPQATVSPPDERELATAENFFEE